MAADVVDINEARPFPLPEEVKDAWEESEEIQEVAQALIERYPKRFGHIGSEDVAYMWRRKGGRSGRRDHLNGATIPGPTSLLMHFARHGIIVWLAYDHVKSRALSHAQVEALVFHQLMRIGKNAKGAPVLRAHDFAAFTAELQAYGYWSADLEKIKDLQLGLGLADEETE